MRLRNVVAAGVLDAGLAALATFGVGIAAAQTLAPAVLGAYAVCFIAMQLASTVSAQLVFVPAQVHALSVSDGDRLPVAVAALRTGLLPAVLASLAVFLTTFVLPAAIPREAVTALLVTSAATALVSPIQNHVRASFHLAGASWKAALVSLAQLLAVVTLLVLALIVFRSPAPPWIPLGTLAGANIVSLSLGLLLARSAAPRAEVPGLRQLAASGRWLLSQALVYTGGDFLSAVLVTWLAGAEAMGYAEAARVASRPVLVLSTGLSAVLGPRAMKASADRRRGDAERIERLFAGVLVLAGAGYVVVTGVDWPLNFVQSLVPAAFTFPGLTTITVVTFTALGVVFPYRSQLIGAGRTPTLTRVEGAGNIIQCAVVALLAPVTGPFAFPTGLGVLALFRLVAFRKAARRIYE